MAVDYGNFGLTQKQIDEAAARAPGYTLGGTVDMLNTDRRLVHPSDVRPDQSRLERLMEQRGNYMYGGTMTGAQDAINAARTNMSPYTSNLSAYGTQYNEAMTGAQGRAAPLATDYLGMDKRGQFGQYAAADQMMALSQQPQGPSAAQAQLDASTAQAMRQQLAMAGSGRGLGGGASAFRQAATNQAQIQGQANAQAAVQRAQEDAMFRQQQAAMTQGAAELYGAGRASDMTAAGYMSNTQLGMQGLNDQYALGMGGLANEATRSGAEMQMSAEQLAHQINMGGLAGNQAYESNLTSIYGINKGAQAMPEQMNPYIAAGLQTAGNVLPFIASGDEEE